MKAVVSASAPGSEDLGLAEFLTRFQALARC
jgi:hypothetical protein